MANETYKIGPPRYVAVVVGALTPRAFRGALTISLTVNYKSFPDYIAKAVKGIRRTTAVQSIAAFNPWRLFGDLCCLYIAFCTAPALPLTVILAVAVAAMVWRDGHIDPPEPSGAEAAADALVLAIFILASQMALLLTVPSLSLFGPGLGMALWLPHEGPAPPSGRRFLQNRMAHEHAVDDRRHGSDCREHPDYRVQGWPRYPVYPHSCGSSPCRLSAALKRDRRSRGPSTGDDFRRSR